MKMKLEIPYMKLEISINRAIQVFLYIDYRYLVKIVLYSKRD